MPDKKNATILLIVILLAVTFFSFLPSLRNGFTNFDDDTYVTENKLITDISLSNIQRIFSSFELGLYKPLVMLSFALEYHYFKLDPSAYHRTNLVLHLMNCVLVFWVVYLLCGTSSAAFITAILFGIHPLHVESVAWVAERKDVLYSFFFLWAAVWYLYYQNTGSRKWYYLSLAAFLFSLFAKPAALVFPFVLLAFDFYRRKKWDKAGFIEKIPFFALLAVFATINMYAQYLDPSPRPKAPLNLVEGFFTANYCIVFYLKKLFWPLKLSCMYSYPEKTGGTFPLQFYLSSVLVVFLAVGIFLLRKRNRTLFFGSLFFLVTLLPALRLIPIFEGVAADRYTYIAYIGIFYVIAKAAAWLYGRQAGPSWPWKGALTVSLVLVIGALSFLTFQRTKAWKDSFTLWNSTLENYPQEPFAYYSRALLYLKKNDVSLAMSDFDKALQLRPGFIEARLNRAVVYSKQGQIDMALREYDYILNASPRCFEAYNNRGNIYGRQGRLDRAIADFNEAIKIDPWYANSYYNRAIAYLAKKEYKKSLQDFRKAQVFGAQVDPALLARIAGAAGQQQ